MSPIQANTSPPILFIGGTGRSGTHVVANLLGHHSRYHAIPIECRFHVNPRGFPDLLAGRVGPEEFLRKLRRFWWRRIKAGEVLPAFLPGSPLGRQVRGLHKIVPRERLDSATERFEAAYADEPIAACRALFLDLLWPLAEEAGKPGLVEMSCFTIAQAPTLARVFPEARFVHSVRDGRDAGSSKAGKRQKRHHPRDPSEGIEWWLGRLRQAEEGARETPPDRLLAISLDELVDGEREPTYRKLLDFLSLDDEPEMRAFFEGRMSAEHAHRERWREGLSPDEQRAVVAEYERALERLEREGYHCAGLLRASYDRELVR